MIFLVLCKHVRGQNTEQMNNQLRNENSQVLRVLRMSAPLFSIRQIWDADCQTHNEDNQQHNCTSISDYVVINEGANQTSVIQ